MFIYFERESEWRRGKGGERERERERENESPNQAPRYQPRVRHGAPSQELRDHDLS